MGYYVTIEESTVAIPEENCFEAFCALRKSELWEDFVNEYGKPRDLYSALCKMGFDVYEDASENVVIDFFDGKLLGDEENYFEIFAPYIPNGQLIHWLGEDGEQWKWKFVDGTMRIVKPKVIWDDDDCCARKAAEKATKEPAKESKKATKKAEAKFVKKNTGKNSVTIYDEPKCVDRRKRQTNKTNGYYAVIVVPSVSCESWPNEFLYGRFGRDNEREALDFTHELASRNLCGEYGGNVDVYLLWHGESGDHNLEVWTCNGGMPYTYDAFRTEPRYLPRRK